MRRQTSTKPLISAEPIKPVDLHAADLALRRIGHEPMEILAAC